MGSGRGGGRLDGPGILGGGGRPPNRQRPVAEGEAGQFFPFLESRMPLDA